MKKKNIKPIKCPYCGKIAQLTPAKADGNRHYECICGARCKAYTDTLQPYGTMASPELRRLRCEAHDTFDQLWKSKHFSRYEAYRWLARALGMNFDDCHIRNFSEFRCSETIRVSQNFLANRAELAA